ncbi:C-terminal binding protein [Ruegeria profundi]|uniref:C-terminal binding protein n=1 Tax=Ruegeria profundi TaxID=1685378 RepID=UPI003C7C708D
MTRQTIAILEPGYAAYDTEASVLAEQDVQIAPVAPETEAVPALQALDPVAILVRERIVDAAVIDACPNLKVVVRYGVGVDNIDLDYAQSRGIYVANVPDYGAETEVSEHALALYLAVQRRIPSRDAEVRQGQWGVGQAALIPSRENATLGLIGCGKIGLQAARKFQALGFSSVLVFDPYLSDDAAQAADVQKVDLIDLCKVSDVISLHAPLTPETRHILNAERIAQMKPTSIVINVSRGGLVDEVALAQALHQGRIFGAGIDVFEQEPVDLTNPLLHSPNTIVSDHAAWYSERSVAVLQRCAAREVARVLEDEQPDHWVNKW